MVFKWRYLWVSGPSHDIFRVALPGQRWSFIINLGGWGHDGEGRKVPETALASVLDRGLEVI